MGKRGVSEYLKKKSVQQDLLQRADKKPQKEPDELLKNKFDLASISTSSGRGHESIYLADHSQLEHKINLTIDFD